jgi:DNA primase
MNDRSEIEAVKATLSDPRDVCQRLGLERGGKRQAGGLLVSCPAHGDKTPSCSVTRGPDGTLRVRCFGCPLSGDVFDLVAATEHLDRERDFAEVLRRAAELAHVRLDERAPPPAPEPPKGHAPLSDEDFAALVLPLLHVGRLDTLEEERERGPSGVSSDVALYLEGRCLLDAARAEGWAALPPPEFQDSWLKMLVDVFGDDVVARSGLTRGDGTFAHPEARLVIPWRDPSGRVYTLQRRHLDDRKPKYVSPSGRAPRWPYGVHRLAAAHPKTPVAIVEGAIDALALNALCRHVLPLGIQGTQGWRASWGKLAEGRLAIVALDADKAGEAAVKQIARDLAEHGAYPVERWTPVKGKDWAEQLAELG